MWASWAWATSGAMRGEERAGQQALVLPDSVAFTLAIWILYGHAERGVGTLIWQPGRSGIGSAHGALSTNIGSYV
jgi:hypothetical protein